MIAARRATSSRTGIRLPEHEHVLRRVVDWRGVLADLRAAGVSGYRLTEILLTSRSTVQGWEEGCEPRHSYGMAILEVHAHFCGAARTHQRLEQAKPV